MKSVAAVCLILVLVAAVAVQGSRAQPLPATSTAFEQCQGRGNYTPDRGLCLPITRIRPAAVEFEAGLNEGFATNEAAVDPDPEWLVQAVTWIAKEAAKAVVGWVVVEVLDRWFGSSPEGPDLVHINQTIFDPAR